ncbi:DUF1844 domain-containing protein [Planctomicrobium sp. SH661]|uniref:DUF1844 domain-containing protein n=1 Tax=Planctomicrobium sp. SH661 TaxID=3448124 RepID=UPI003F5CA466
MTESSSKGDKPQIEIHTDEDWKSRVKAEDAKLDAELKGEATSETADELAEADDDDSPNPAQLPAASLLTLFQMLSTQSIVALGLIPGLNGKTTVQIPLAKHFIDLLSVLETKCKGNLTAEEQRFLDGTLHELRMAYVGVSKQSKS